jgi:hypothetical protein
MPFDTAGAAADISQRAQVCAPLFKRPGITEAINLVLRNPGRAAQWAQMMAAEDGVTGLDQPFEWPA